jgi:hypothetical protein
MRGGATQARLLEVGRARGYTRSYVGTIIAQILPKAGRRKRRPGAGPKTPELACDILAFARRLVGDKARKYLLAAAHLAKIEDHRRVAGAVEPQAAETPVETDTTDFLPDQIGSPAPLVLNL